MEAANTDSSTANFMREADSHVLEEQKTKASTKDQWLMHLIMR